MIGRLRKDMTLENGSPSSNIILMNPPYSLKWSADKELLDDERFKDFGVLAPKGKADFAFVLHGFHRLSDDGTMAVILPHGVLFRGQAEGKIRKKLLEMGAIDAIIGLPVKLFNNTDIPTAIMVLKKNRSDKSVFFIDASNDFEKGKNQNILTDENIQKIVEAYQARKDIDKYAHLASFDEIKENDFNCNIPRFVDTFEPEPMVDLLEVAKDMHKTSVEIHENTDKLIEMLGDLTSDDPYIMKGLQALIKELKDE